MTEAKVSDNSLPELALEICKRKRCVTARELQRTSKAFKTAKQASEALASLAKSGYGDFIYDDHGGGKGRPVWRFKLCRAGQLDTARGKEAAPPKESGRVAERNLDKVREDLRRETARRKDAEKELAEALERVQIMEDLSGPAAHPFHIQSKPSTASATAIICANDWHCEQSIDADLVDGLNWYNLDVFRDRVRRLWEKSIHLLRFSRGLCSIHDAVIWLGGDLINGYIHQEMEESNFAGPAEAILFVQDAVARGISTLLKDGELGSIRVVCNYGNHGRATQRRRVSTGWKTSWEWLMYQNLAGAFREDSRVAFQVARGYFNYVDVQGHVIRFHHGDNIRYHGGVGGITIPVNKAVHQWNLSKRADYDIFGHYHQFVNMHRWVCSGSLVGYDPYAQSIKAEYQEPTQTFVVIDRVRGKTMALPIFVSGKTQ